MQSTKIKESLSAKIFNIANIVFMFLLMILALYPMIYILFASLSSHTLLMAHKGPILWPLGFSLHTYKAVFQDPMILSGYMNTLFIVVAGVLLNILMTALGAYFLSRKGPMWTKQITVFIIFTMYFSGGLIPFYLVVTGMGLENNLLALILPTAINTFNLIIMRTAFESIPVSMEESARLDGAGDFAILFKIIMPLSMSTIAVMILYYAVGHWNSWFNAMVFIRDSKLYPLQLVLRSILISNDTTSMTQNTSIEFQESISETVKYAVIIVATLPILAAYPFLQKYFVKGVMIGAVKG